MTVLIAIAYGVVGALCLQRPDRIAHWVGRSLRGVAGAEATQAPWLRARGTRIAIRLIGVLALINAVTLLATLGHG